MLDLTCEAPHCFNIRHPERGVQTRRTRRSGGNLHCIMAFQMQDSGEWDALGESISPEPAKETVDSSRSHTPIETLDSSESDFPRGPEEASVAVGDKEESGMETLTREDAAKLCVWSDGTTSPSSSLEREIIDDKKTEEVVEDVDAPNKRAEAETPQDMIVQVTPQQFDLTAGPLVDHDTPNDPVQIEEEAIDEEDILNKTLTPSKMEVATERADNQPSIEVERSESPQREHVRRSGTYLKSRSSLSPSPVVVVEPEGGRQLETPTAGGHQLETPTASDGEDVMTGDYTRRSGTFRKEKPSLPTKAPQIEATDVGVAARPTDTNAVHTKDMSEDESVGSSLQMEPTISSREDEAVLHSPEEQASSQESGIKRSTTFRKEKPTLEVSPIVRGSNSSHSDREGDADEEDVLPYRTRSTEPPTQSPIVIPTVSLTLPSDSSAPVAVGILAVYPDSDDSSVEESYLLVDNNLATGGRGVKRSGTFTKERPEHTLFGDDYF